MTRIVIFLLTSFLLIPPEKETKRKLILSTNPDIKELFYVLKSDPEIRHGTYKMTFKDRTIVEGYYTNGLRDSIWNQYDEHGKLKMTGNFSNDKRIGSWKFFDNLKNLEQEIDYTNHAVLFYKTKFAQYPFKIIDGSDTLVSVLDRPPLFIGGSSRVDEYIASEIVIPLHKPTDKVAGTVYVEFIIDSDGRTSNHRVLKGISTCCNHEALRVVKTLPDEWLPGILNGHNVSVYYTIPVIFNEKLNEVDISFIVN
jgi:protein TonB